MTTDLAIELEAAKLRIKELECELEMADEVIAIRNARVKRAYTERAYATAALARMAIRAGLNAGVRQEHDSVMAVTGFGTILYVDTPTGQVSWHYADEDSWLLEGLPLYEQAWDGTSRSKDGSFAVWEQNGKGDDEAADKAFKFGYTLACCTLTNMHDQPGMAKDVLKDIGLTRAEVKAMDLTEYDAKALRQIERHTGHGDLYVKKKRKA